MSDSTREAGEELLRCAEQHAAAVRAAADALAELTQAAARAAVNAGEEHPAMDDEFQRRRAVAAEAQRKQAESRARLDAAHVRLATHRPPPLQAPSSAAGGVIDITEDLQEYIDGTSDFSLNTRLRIAFGSLYAVGYDPSRARGAMSLGPFIVNGVPVSAGFHWGDAINEHPLYLAAVYRRIVEDRLGLVLPVFRGGDSVLSLGDRINASMLALSGEALVPVAMKPPFERCGTCPNATFCRDEVKDAAVQGPVDGEDAAQGPWAEHVETE